MVGTDRSFEEGQTPLVQRPCLLPFGPVVVHASEVEDEERQIAVGKARSALDDRQSLGRVRDRQARSCLPLRRAPPPPAAASPATARDRSAWTAARPSAEACTSPTRSASACAETVKTKGPAVSAATTICPATLTAEQIDHLSDGVTVRFGDSQVHVDPIFFDLDEGRLSSVEPEVEGVGVSRGDRSIDRRTDTENRRLRRSR